MMARHVGLAHHGAAPGPRAFGPTAGPGATAQRLDNPGPPAPAPVGCCWRGLDAPGTGRLVVGSRPHRAGQRRAQHPHDRVAEGPSFRLGRQRCRALVVHPPPAQSRRNPRRRPRPNHQTAHRLRPLQHATVRPGPAPSPAPPPISPIAASPASRGGPVEAVRPDPSMACSAMYAAFLRPDPIHTSLVTAVAWIDPTLVRLAGYAGAVEPGGGPWANQAPIPVALRPAVARRLQLGFQDPRLPAAASTPTDAWRDPLVNGAATLVISPDGRPTSGVGSRLPDGAQVAFARQNLSLIVDGGHTCARRWPRTAPASGAPPSATTVLRLAIRRRRHRRRRPRLRRRQRAERRHRSPRCLPGRARCGPWSSTSTRPGSTSSPTRQRPPGQPPADLGVIKLLPDMRPSTSDYLTASSRDFIGVFRRF